MWKVKKQVISIYVVFITFVFKKWSLIYENTYVEDKAP